MRHRATAPDTLPLAIRALVTAGAVLLAACSGPNRDGPIGDQTAAANARVATLTVSEGQDATAPAGTSLATPPTVRAVDVAGTAVAGASITFRVLAGGGSVEGATVTTGADGAARPTSWRLGTRVGAQELEARVAGRGVSTAVRALATANATAAAAVVTAPVAGGTLTPTLTGSGFEGLTITVKPGTFTSAVPLTISVRPLPTIAGVAPADVVGAFTIDAGGAQPDSVLTLRVPVREGSDAVVFPYLYNSATGDLEPLLSLRSDSSSIEVSLAALRGVEAARRASLTAGATTRVLGRSPVNLSVQSAVDPMTLVLLRDPIPRLGASTPTTDFNPAIHSLDFVNRGSSLSPGGFCLGAVLTMYWYFEPGVPTLRSYAWSPVVPPTPADPPQKPPYWYTNHAGVRLASLAQLAASATDLGKPADVKDLQTENPRRNWLQFLAAMTRSRRPQPFLVWNGTLGNTGDDAHAVLAINASPGFGTDQGTARFADPNFPGISRTLVFKYTTNDFQELPSGATGDVDQKPYRYLRWMPITMLSYTAMTEIESLFGANSMAADGNAVRVGDGSRFPQYALTADDVEIPASGRLTITDTAARLVVRDKLEPDRPMKLEVRLADHPNPVEGVTRLSDREVRVSMRDLFADATERDVRVLVRRNTITKDGPTLAYHDSRRFTLVRPGVRLYANDGNAMVGLTPTESFTPGVARTFKLIYLNGVIVRDVDLSQLSVGPSSNPAVTVTGVAAQTEIAITLTTSSASTTTTSFDVLYRGRRLQTVSATVTVRSPTTVEVSPKTVTVPLGTNTTFSAVVKDQLGAVMPGIAVTWQSSAPSVATVNSSSGVATAVAGTGTATITASVVGYPLATGSGVLTAQPQTLNYELDLLDYEPVLSGAIYRTLRAGDAFTVPNQTRFYANLRLNGQVVTTGASVNFIRSGAPYGPTDVNLPNDVIQVQDALNKRTAQIPINLTLTNELYRRVIGRTLRVEGGFKPFDYVFRADGTYLVIPETTGRSFTLGQDFNNWFVQCSDDFGTPKTYKKRLIGYAVVQPTYIPSSFILVLEDGTYELGSNYACTQKYTVTGQ